MPTFPDAIFAPGPKQRATDESLDHIAGMLDDMFRIPGTKIRFGLDAIVGWIPGIGDAFAGIASFIIVFAAWQRGAPGITLARMVLNVLLEMMIGAVPVVGDLFHVAWKCNRRNYKLLMRVRQAPRAPTTRDWLVVVLIVIAITAAVMAPLALLVWMFHWRH
ncbi:MAG: DUF4112 domain-containing protein [Acidobacteriota bacterium]|nr:DUF4112 domain-containing protein [Acidobacteriota bacterium]